jgi:hypothetical protein
MMRIGRSGLTAAIILSLAAPARGTAQAAPLASGQRVRITVSDSAAARLGGRRWDARLLAATPDSIALDTTLASGPLTIPRDDVVKLERYAGRKAKTGKGALIGLGIGAVGGAIGMAIGASSTSCSGWFDFYCEDATAEWAATGAVAGGLLGAGIGAIVGGVAKGDSWKTVQMPVTVAPTVSRGGPGIAVRVTF